LSLALLSFCLLGLSGCSESNESEFNKQAAKTGGTQVENTVPPPKNQMEYAQTQKSSQTKASHYPGARQ